MSSTTASEVNTNVNEALATLSNLWQKMLQIIQAVSATSASSLTVEPDLVGLQKIRKEYEQLMASLKTTATWSKANELQSPADESITIDELESLLTEQDELKKEFDRVTDQLKRMSISLMLYNFKWRCCLLLLKILVYVKTKV
ncbi:unnamed protein product [Mucor hiemalis]